MGSAQRVRTVISLVGCGIFLLMCRPLPEEVETAYQELPDIIDFNFHIRPILADKCYACHGPDEKARKADLRLDMEEYAFLPLKNNPDEHALVRGTPTQSKALTLVLSNDPESMMPPPESKLTLSGTEKALLYKWVEQGAIWKKHWSFLVPEKSQLPEVSDVDWPRNEIDYFILDGLDFQKMKPNPEASKEALIRRLSMDLTGLPPTLEEIDQFLKDSNEAAYERVVDRLLASPHFGERWCWNWLDAARYSDTNGFQGDPERKMWPWRDWVIRAFNENMPYDRFSIEQIAGDLISAPTKDQILATAFNRNHMYNGEGGRIPEETRVENVFDRTETFGTLWLGLTFNCSRCHDHKFDPILQKEYYQLFDYFNQTSEEGIGYNGRIKPVLDLSDTLDQQEVMEIEKLIELKNEELLLFESQKFPRAPGLTAAESEEANNLDGDHRFALGFDPVKRNPYYLRLLSDHFEKVDPEYYQQLQKFRSLISKKDQLTADNLQVMVMDHLERPRPTYLLERGIYNKRGEKVTSQIPQFLPALDTSLGNNRLALAEWLFSDTHPLTSRVTVNRIWQSIFGVGLVKTPEDFGIQGARPTHPELLDWLAVEFRESGWDVKRMIKYMVMSSTYRQSSVVSPYQLEQDPENKWLSRAHRYRWPSWMLRDQALSLSGLLNEQIGGPAVKPYQPPGIWEEATFGFKKYVQDHGDDLYRRTLYIFWRRIVGPTMLFDNASRQTCEVKPIRTNTPLHALTTLNDIAYVEASRVMAERIMLAEKDPEKRIELAFRLATARKPSNEEKTILTSRLEKLKAEFYSQKQRADSLLNTGEFRQNENLDPVEQAAYMAICSVILNLDEVLSRQ